MSNCGFVLFKYPVAGFKLRASKYCIVLFDNNNPLGIVIISPVVKISVTARLLAVAIAKALYTLPVYCIEISNQFCNDNALTFLIYYSFSR